MQNYEQIKKVVFFNAGSYACNLKCEYCYLEAPKQESKFFTPEELMKTFSKKALGSIAFINYVTMGETLLSEDNLKVIELFLREGHVVNLVTNLTHTKNLQKLIDLPVELREKLIIHASLHYLELVRLNLLDEYFSNLNKLKQANISFHMDLTVYDKYMPILDEIKNVCLEKTGLLPNITIALDKDNGWTYHSFFDEKAKQKIIETFNAKELDIQTELFFKKKNDKKCNAGLWSLTYDWHNQSCITCNGINKKIKTPFDGAKKIEYKPAINCPHSHCFCGEIFQSWGMIPEWDCPTFFEFYLKDKGFYNETIKKLTDVKLKDTNKNFLLKLFDKFMEIK